MSPSRIVVGLSPANLVSHRPQAGAEEVPKAGRIKAAPTLGLLFWSEGWDDWCTVIVKAVLKRGESDLRSAAMVFATPAQADPFERPVDFVPWKGGVDVLVVGAVELSGPVEKGRGLSGEVVAGGVSTAFDVPADEPIVSPLPLARAQLRGAEGLDAMLGPSNFFDISQTKFHHEEKVSLRCYLAASQGLLRQAVQPGSTVSIKLSQPDGSSSKQLFSADYELPKLTPRILVSPAKQGGAEVRVAAELDTILVDCTKQQMELTWRARFPAGGPKVVDRVLLGFAADTNVEDRATWKDILRELPRGSFQFAWTWEDAARGVPPPRLTKEEETLARYQSWRYPLAPEPLLSEDEYAEIGLELAERAEPRCDVLERHQLDEHAYALEERGYLERITAETRLGSSQTSQRLITARKEAATRLRERRLAKTGAQS